jgi:hypothetical protein
VSLHPAFTDIVLASAVRGAGTYGSGPVSNPGTANIVEFFIAVTAVGGSTQTIDAVVQTSPDNSSWTSVTASAISQLTATGQAHSFAFVSTALYAQVLVTVGGTGTPTATCVVGVIVL